MPCDLATIQEALCESGIGKVTSRIELLQIIAQSYADTITGADTDLESILSRACESGILKESSPIALEQIIAQNICNTIT